MNAPAVTDFGGTIRSFSKGLERRIISIKGPSQSLDVPLLSYTTTLKTFNPIITNQTNTLPNPQLQTPKLSKWVDALALLAAPDPAPDPAPDAELAA
jgi:hypothetical protein